MSVAISMFLFVMLVSALAAVSTIAFIWFLWFRNTRRALLETQKTLIETKASLDKLVSLQQAYMGTPPPVPLMDEEGGDIIESDVDGMFIRLPPDVSPQERERIIHYLKSEGFLSDD